MTDNFVAGIVVFILNLVAVSLILPRVESARYRKYYEALFGNREREIAKVTLTDAGLRYSADGAESFWPWERIRQIEETEDSIFFYCDGNGFGVAKGGFPYQQDAARFLLFAKECQFLSHRKPLE